jgi:geranylgeranyl pyrophosphate synthase
MPDRIALVLEVLHAGSLIIDDVEDDAKERRGEAALHLQVGVPLAINTGSWMYFWALAELAQLGLPADRELVAHRLAVSTLVRAHQGQALDLATRVDELDPVNVESVVDAVTRLKTGALCQLATELGALAAGAQAPTVAAIARFGNEAGCALQMLDDLGAVASPQRREKAREDLRGARPTWPWVWLAELDPFAWTRLARTCRAVQAGDYAADTLASELAELVVPLGRSRVHALLAASIENLVATVGSGPAVDAIAAELRRMEASYG